MPPGTPPPPGVPPPAQARSAPFSMHSRGVQLLDRHRLLDIKSQIESATGHLRDISTSFYVFLLFQNWLTLYNAIITIISCSFFTYYRDRQDAFPLDWIGFAFVVLLPLLAVVAWAFNRREQALRDLAETKTLLLHIFLLHRDSIPTGTLPPSHLTSVQQLLRNYVAALQDYFRPPRFYSQSYPLLDVKTKMTKIAQDRAKQVRRIVAHFKKLSRANEALHRIGLPAPQAVKLIEFTFLLQSAFERMANIKEYRTPQGIRAMARFYVVLFVPLFFGPSYALIRSFAFQLFFAVLVNATMVSLLNVSIMLEDPFDNQGLDGIYVDEALFEAHQAMSMDEDAELMAPQLPDVMGRPSGIPALPGQSAGFGTPGPTPSSDQPPLSPGDIALYSGGSDSFEASPQMVTRLRDSDKVDSSISNV